jgi:transposase
LLLALELQALGHDARLMPAKYIRPYSKGQKNDFRDAEAIAEAVQRPTMRFVATKTGDQLDLQGAKADIDGRPYHPRQDIQARQSLSALSVRAGSLGRIGQGRAKALGPLWAQVLDRGVGLSVPFSTALLLTAKSNRTRGGLTVF